MANVSEAQGTIEVVAPSESVIKAIENVFDLASKGTYDTDLDCKTYCNIDGKYFLNADFWGSGRWGYEENIQKLFTWHKKMKYLSNAFSLQMLDTQSINTMRFEPISIEEVKKQDFVSVVGHADLANILSGMLEKEVKMNKSYLHL